MVKLLKYGTISFIIIFACYLLFYLCSEDNRYTCYRNKIIINNRNLFELCYDNLYSKQLFRKFIPGSDAEIKAYYEIRKNGYPIFKFERASCPMECGNCSYNIRLDTVTNNYIFLIDSYGSCIRLPNRYNKELHVNDINMYYKPYYKPYFVNHYYYRINKDSSSHSKTVYNIDSLDFCGITDSFKIKTNNHCFQDWRPWL
jgi:hypothetical protein